MGLVPWRRASRDKCVSRTEHVHASPMTRHRRCRRCIRICKAITANQFTPFIPCTYVPHDNFQQYCTTLDIATAAKLAGTPILCLLHHCRNCIFNVSFHFSLSPSSFCMSQGHFTLNVPRNIPHNTRSGSAEVRMRECNSQNNMLTVAEMHTLRQRH